MDTLLTQVSGFFGAYWGMVLVAVVFAVYAVFQRGQAKQIILSLMLRVEKEAEALALATGDAKFAFVVEKGWELLPTGAKVFLPKVLFIELARTLYEQAKKYLLSLNDNLSEEKPKVLQPHDIALPSDPPPVNPIPIMPVATKTLPIEGKPADNTNIQ